MSDKPAERRQQTPERVVERAREVVRWLRQEADEHRATTDAGYNTPNAWDDEMASRADAIDALLKLVQTGDTNDEP